MDWFALMERVDILAELEDVIRTMPPWQTFNPEAPEGVSWVGRALAVIGRWNPTDRKRAREFADSIAQPMARESYQEFLGLTVLLNEARSDLRMETIGPVNTAIGQGLVFDYFDEIRKLIVGATSDLLFVDPYLDAEFVSRYLPHVSSSVGIRLPAREKLRTLIPAAQIFMQQNQHVRIELRSAPHFHDRYILIDKTSCYQSGSSFKDGGRTAPTTITQITDAFIAVQNTYEQLWQKANPEQL